MDDEILKAIQNKISEIPQIKYVDEDWGQLNLYGLDVPVKFPCALFDIKDGGFENMGNDRRQTPSQRQLGRFTLDLAVGNLKLTNTSGRAPQSQKSKAWEIHTLIKLVHEKLQGFSPRADCSKLIRMSAQRIRRDDGVQEYHILYGFEITDC